VGIKISALPPVTDSSNLTLPANEAGVTSKVQTGVANGLPYLAGDGKIPIVLLPSAAIGGLNYQGVWNANTNSPLLGNGGAGGVKGDYYVVSVAGSTSIDGISEWKIGDWIVNNGTTWDKIDNTDSVTSVNTFTGAVTLTATNIPNTPAGNISATDVQSAINELDSEKQPQDATLTALSGFNTNGLLTQTAPDTFTGRTIVGTVNQVNVVSGDGVPGNPTLSTPQDIHTGASPTFDNITITNDIRGNRVAIGNAAIFGVDGNDYARFFDLSQTITDFSAATNWSPLFSYIFVDPTVDLDAGNTKFIFSHDVETTIPNTNSKNIWYLNNLYALANHAGNGNVEYLYSSVSDAFSSGSGNVTELIGNYVLARNLGSGNVTTNIGSYIATGNYSTGSITDNYGQIIPTPGGVISNSNTGLFIDNQNVASNSLAVRSNGGNWAIKDFVGIGVLNPRVSLEVGSPVGSFSPDIYFSYDGLFHPFTDYVPTNVWAHVHRIGLGGTYLDAYGDGGSVALAIRSNYGGTAVSSPATIVEYVKSDGGTGKAALTGSEVGLQIQNFGDPVVDCLGDKSVKFYGNLTSLSGRTINRITTATNYTVLLTDYYIGVTSTASLITISLPAATLASNGRIYIIKDESGGAGTNNIIIEPNGAELIDGALSKSISINYGAVAIICDGFQWFVIHKSQTIPYEFLLANDPVPQPGLTIARTPTYSAGLISNETWELSGLSVKSIDYIYSSGLLDKTIVKIYDIDGVTVLAQTTETQLYSGGLDSGSTIVRNI